PPARLSTLSLHDALPICLADVSGTAGAAAAEEHLLGAGTRHADRDLVEQVLPGVKVRVVLRRLAHVTQGFPPRGDGDGRDRSRPDRKSTRLNSSHVKISY